jgi:ACS family allantoate permease-like MFS transporter
VLTHPSFLGFFEASIAPALIIFTGQWYKANEQGYRTGLWTSMNSVGGILGGAIAYDFAMADKKGQLVIAGWKLIFIFLGCLTVASGVLFWLVVPESAEQGWFLNDREKEVTRARLASNHNSLERTEFKLYQVREALLDPFVWLYLVVALLTCIPNGGFTK